MILEKKRSKVSCVNPRPQCRPVNPAKRQGGSAWPSKGPENEGFCFKGKALAPYLDNLLQVVKFEGWSWTVLAQPNPNPEPLTFLYLWQ